MKHLYACIMKLRKTVSLQNALLFASGLRAPALPRRAAPRGNFQASGKPVYDRNVPEAQSAIRRLPRHATASNPSQNAAAG
jgi:hypothetical protein